MEHDLQERSRSFSRAYPVCRRLMPDGQWQQVITRTESLDLFADMLNNVAAEQQIPEYLAELARLELYIYNLESQGIQPDIYTEKLSINPTLEIFENTWKNLAFLFAEEMSGPAPEKGSEHVIVWHHPVNSRVRVKPVAKEDLLVMKMALEGLSPRDVAEPGNVLTAALESALIRAMNDGIIIGPKPRIKRHFLPEKYPNIDGSFFSARIFSLQWHITQACDLHCRHCYDRDQYKSLSFEQGKDILADLSEFCSSHNIHGQVTFTGGNPLLHPDFERLYSEAADLGLTTAVLGNPTTREQLERLKAIQPPAFYQVSLEGLAEHNDYMRGKGHFNRVLSFLDLLRDMQVFSMVMLTLTRDNMDQVLPLAEILSHKTDLFTFNRLSLVGEGAKLVSVDRDKYPAFLKAYMEAVGVNPCLGLKDNLLNIHYFQDDRPLFGGCTGFGCGAAFNFITILADGTVHACRKFPSPLGSILDNTLSEIYHSAAARRYREGAAECLDCSIRPVCGGCLAVAYSHGRDIFREKDPYCFIDSKYLLT
ncbi:MAG: selenobiotic family peptide radical SAM maturase [Deltaproteobacteria bacterium]|nr:selenobiotic family peptide radical SAM maturase [Deltaproteobacteria bacterium]